MLTTTSRNFIASTLIALTLSACGDDGEPTTSAATTLTTSKSGHARMTLPPGSSASVQITAPYATSP